MTDQINYTFKIENFTPETMPFGRLVDYYQNLKKMLGDTDHIHLVDVVEGSLGSYLAIDTAYVQRVEDRVRNLKARTAPKLSLIAHDEINAMLREDEASASFYSEVLSDNVIVFPGKKREDAELLRVRDAASFVGELYHIAGSRGHVKARMNTPSYGVVFCKTTLEVGKSLRDFLFEDVKVSGRGVWSRDHAGNWDIEDFHITDFAPVRREGLREAVNRLRSIKVNWPDDTIRLIDEIEERDEGVA